MDEGRRQILGWTGLIIVSLALTFGLSVTIASFVVERPAVVPSDEASYLARHGRRCLAQVATPDVDVTPAFARFWERLGEEDCTPGSWLSQFQEFGQTMEQYRSEGPNRPEDDAPIVLSVMGDFRVRGEPGRELVEPVREFLGLYYQRAAVLGDPVPLPEDAWSPDRGAEGQYDAEALLSSLKGSCGAGRAGCLTVTDEDLYVNTLQYVFGLGHFHRRVGVFSMYRLWEDRYDLDSGGRESVRAPEPLRRALKVAVHEMGHELTVAHCVHYRHCVMAGTNSLAESDTGSLMLCPLDHEKLRWNLRFDPRRRYEQLAAFGRRHGLHREARYWQEMALAMPLAPNAVGGAR
jgi:predicted Zn-dependent protease